MTLHLTVDGHRKVIASKLEDAPGFQQRQAVVQALIMTAIDLAKERAISINWQNLEKLYPYRGPQAAPTGGPPPADATPQGSQT